MLKVITYYKPHRPYTPRWGVWDASGLILCISQVSNRRMKCSTFHTPQATVYYILKHCKGEHIYHSMINKEVNWK